MTVKDNTQLIETMSSLMLIGHQCCQGGVLSVEPVIDQVKEPFLKVCLQMVLDGRGLRHFCCWFLFC